MPDERYLHVGYPWILEISQIYISRHCFDPTLSPPHKQLPAWRVRSSETWSCAHSLIVLTATTYNCSVFFFPNCQVLRWIRSKCRVKKGTISNISAKYDGVKTTLKQPNKRKYTRWKIQQNQTRKHQKLIKKYSKQNRGCFLALQTAKTPPFPACPLGRIQPSWAFLDEVGSSVGDDVVKNGVTSSKTPFPRHPDTFWGSVSEVFFRNKTFWTWKRTVVFELNMETHFYQAVQACGALAGLGKCQNIQKPLLLHLVWTKQPAWGLIRVCNYNLSFISLQETQSRGFKGVLVESLREYLKTSS